METVDRLTLYKMRLVLPVWPFVSYSQWHQSRFLWVNSCSAFSPHQLATRRLLYRNLHAAEIWKFFDETKELFAEIRKPETDLQLLPHWSDTGCCPSSANISSNNPSRCRSKRFRKRWQWSSGKYSARHLSTDPEHLLLYRSFDRPTNIEQKWEMDDFIVWCQVRFTLFAFYLHRRFVSATAAVPILCLKTHFDHIGRLRTDDGKTAGSQTSHHAGEYVHAIGRFVQ